MAKPIFTEFVQPVVMGKTIYIRLPESVQEFFFGVKPKDNFRMEPGKDGELVVRKVV